ncbi:MAG: hypothetical protein K6D96_09660 [Acetatifactor sp.]|nr:hypothetical protein [Acetatifactor sp.]
MTGIGAATTPGVVGGAVLGATLNPYLAAMAGGATYGALNATSEAIKNDDYSLNAAKNIAYETGKDALIGLGSAMLFMAGYAELTTYGLSGTASMLLAGGAANAGMIHITRNM